jgi:hypothetical protein
MGCSYVLITPTVDGSKIKQYHLQLPYKLIHNETTAALEIYYVATAAKNEVG